MARAARVTDVGAVREFRAALLEFIQEACSAIDQADAEVQRTELWLRLDRLPHWKAEARRRAERVSRARSELAQAEAAKSMGKTSTVDERKALERAKRELAEAEDKVAATSRWIREFERQSHQYRAQVQQLRSFVEGRMAGSAELLRALEARLDEYLATAPPPRDDEHETDDASASVARSPTEAGPAIDPRALRRIGRNLSWSDEPADARAVAGALGAFAAVAQSPGFEPGDPPGGDQRILLGPIGAGSRLCLERRMSERRGDSGWRVYDATGPAGSAGVVEVKPIADALGDYARILGGPEGVLVIVEGGRVIAAFDAQDRPLGHTIAPEPPEDSGAPPR